MYSSFEGSVIYDKAHMEQVTAAINILEKKKIKYKIIPMPVYGDEGLEITFAIIIVVDKKNTKRNKKMISNNKYILFNSWYTKNRSESWPNSHTMWNLMKQQPAAKPFIDIFDFMEKVGKSVEIKKSLDDTNVGESTATTNKGTDNANIKEGNERRVKLYNEFYRIATITFTSNSAPSSSFLYDIKLSKENAAGLERLTRHVLENGINVFKSVLLKQDQPQEIALSSTSKKGKEKPAKGARSTIDQEKVISRKRKQIAPAAKPIAKKSKQRAEPAPEMTMEDDHTDDTQMSFS
ncbi:39K/PP31 [Agrotis segetum nucleopolyhedrovirus A]|uniref:39K/PP31 n=1 Tax=Agrotis segetum nuclear polyhedrosis virus TaxID=1962501 RepID=Q287E0_NPVAS|nr:39K/PP31 [Agrotis segetum nucleopolyhedrovirus A]AAZ38298.1 39K/PP31 [Agrotis segetum nucleopolyhedrovirus A]